MYRNKAVLRGVPRLSEMVISVDVRNQNVNPAGNSCPARFIITNSHLCGKAVTRYQLHKACNHLNGPSKEKRSQLTMNKTKKNKKI